MVVAATVNAMSVSELLAHTQTLLDAGDYGPMLKATLTRLNEAVGDTDSVSSLKHQVVRLRSEIDNLNEKLRKLRELLDRD